MITITSIGSTSHVASQNWDIPRDSRSTHLESLTGLLECLPGRLHVSLVILEGFHRSHESASSGGTGGKSGGGSEEGHDGYSVGGG
jgi:hypothetical protein